MKKKINFLQSPMTDSVKKTAIIIVHRVYFNGRFFEFRTGEVLSPEKQLKESIMKKLLIPLLALSVTAFAAEESTTTTTTEEITTTTKITTRKVKTQKKQEWSPLKVAILDFTSADIKGQKFLDHRNKAIKIPAQETLNAADRKSINSIMQGFVRMIDAWDNTRTNQANREEQVLDNRRDWAKAKALYNTVVKGESRPMVLGAEYLGAYLGRKSDLFQVIDSAAVQAAMTQLQNEPDFPKNALLKLAQKTGATHLIYGTVSDLRTKVNSFKGYGIETKTTNYQLDVILKVVDLVKQSTVYSNVYTGNYREQRPVSGSQFDNNIFQNLMTSALEQAAEELAEITKPGRKNKLSVTPMPYKVTVNPTGGFLFKPATAEIFIDGVRVGNGGGTFSVPAGKHRVEIKANGYKTNAFDINVTGDAVITSKLAK